ncbi:MAG: DUF3011 domain-containing protein [Steroidobacteraceae bacterium]|nr:DUF3011 domain-containing protein [Steroidobacteraceae bacterium]
MSRSTTTTMTFAASLLCGALMLLGGAPGAQASTVVCESRGGATQACSVNTSGGVRLTRQLSSQGCWQNDTWGYDANRIWVTNGCRAEFEVGSPKESSNKGDAVAVAAIIGLAAAAAIASNNDDHHHNNNNKNNRYDDDYYDRRYDDYERSNNYGRYGYNGYGGDPRRTFTCESNHGRREYCSIPKRGHVEVYRQLSSKSCSHGRSWGVQGNEVWVDEGCRAMFAVY